MDRKERAIKNRDLTALIWAILHENSTLIVLILSLLGGMDQYFNLFAISPSVTAYYSPTQALIDGILFLFFNLVIFTIYVLSFLLYQYIAKQCNNVIRIVVFILNLGLILYLMMVLTLNGYFWLLPIVSIPLFLLSAILGPDEKSTAESTTSQSDVKTKTVNREIAIVLATYFFLSYLAFSTSKKQLFMTAREDVYNYTILESQLNRGKKSNFVLTYNNGAYLFFKDPSTGAVAIIKADAELTDFNNQNK